MSRMAGAADSGMPTEAAQALTVGDKIAQIMETVMPREDVIAMRKHQVHDACMRADVTALARTLPLLPEPELSELCDASCSRYMSIMNVCCSTASKSTTRGHGGELLYLQCMALLLQYRGSRAVVPALPDGVADASAEHEAEPRLPITCLTSLCSAGHFVQGIGPHVYVAIATVLAYGADPLDVPGFSVERIRSEPKGFGGKALQVYQLLKRAAVLGGPLAVEEVIKEVKTTPGWECVASLPVMQDLSCGRRSKRFLVALWSEGRSRRHTARPSRATGTVWLKIHKELPRAALAEVIQQSFSRQTAQSEVPIGPPPRSVESNNGVVTVSDEWVCDGCASVNAGDLAVCVFCGVMR